MFPDGIGRNEETYCPVSSEIWYMRRLDLSWYHTLFVSTSRAKFAAGPPLADPLFPTNKQVMYQKCMSTAFPPESAAYSYRRQVNWSLVRRAAVGEFALSLPALVKEFVQNVIQTI